MATEVYDKRAAYRRRREEEGLYQVQVWVPRDQGDAIREAALRIRTGEPASAPQANKTDDGKVVCSFCGKDQDHVEKIITASATGTGIAICDGCVDLCVDIIIESKPGYAATVAAKVPSDQSLGTEQATTEEVTSDQSLGTDQATAEEVTSDQSLGTNGAGPVTSDQSPGTRLSAFDWALGFPVNDRPIPLKEADALTKHARKAGIIGPRRKLATAGQWEAALNTFDGT